MLTALYVVFLAAYGCITWHLWKIYTIQRLSYALLLLLVNLGLTYDAMITLLGRFVGEGSLLRKLSFGRYAIHGIFTPLTMIFGFGLLRYARSGVGRANTRPRIGVSRCVKIEWAQNRRNHLMMCVTTTFLIFLGVYEDIIILDLHLDKGMDTLRYVRKGHNHGPPIASLVTIFFFIVAGISLWRHSGWPWLAVGSITMLILGGIGVGNLFYIGNAGEIIFMATNLCAARRFLS